MPKDEELRKEILKETHSTSQVAHPAIKRCMEIFKIYSGGRI